MLSKTKYPCIDPFRIATHTDADAITQLINNAYRPKSGNVGWTHEAKLVSGNRINVTQVKDIISRTDSIILLGSKDSEIIACVHVEKTASASFIGLLAVNAALQGGGAGKQMLAHAEDFASTRFGSHKFIMAVVSTRHELIAFYIRRGYLETGDVMDYPVSANVGIPKLPGLKIQMLEKCCIRSLEKTVAP